MAGTNDFKAFATDANANVTSQEEWETLTALKKGFSSGKASSAQVSKALRQPSTMAAVLGQFIANAELDALDDGDVDGLVAKLATAITTNLRLGAGAPAIGIPFFWPSSAMPNTVMTEWADMVFLKFNGATFSAATYPKLALVIPSLTLPDARGEFPRIWDDGRGVDSGRALLSTQGDAVQRMTGSLSQMVYSVSQQASDINGVFSATSGAPNIVQAYSSVGALRYMNVIFDTQNVVRTSTETRSRNIAFNFLVRAK
ncbi:TPA: tail fiber protein [Escherichia coli]|nr:tail fiber protein [Escherichia coli]HCJ8184019.1 tail fiber protein [Escherichia coli]HCJ8372118.1 tail fiber protein [Escherichia coli]HCJ8495725.1 tail fiber protein [Escherichia coli]HCJ8680776.1 tail fiber protein [Escherichia coli]